MGQSRYGLGLRTRQSGFTIVELLIVVVVIAVLAAIATVAYNGITDRAKRSSTESSLVTVGKKVQLYSIDNSDTYPTSLSMVGVEGSDRGGATYRYSVDNTVTPKTYCVTAIQGQYRAYLSSAQLEPIQGSCHGHENDGVYATNLAIDPSFENGIDGWRLIGDGSLSRSSEKAHSGKYSLKVTPAPGSRQIYIEGPRIKIDGGAEYTFSINGLYSQGSGYCNFNTGFVLYSENGSIVGSLASGNGMDDLGWSPVNSNKYRISSTTSYYVSLRVGLSHTYGVCAAEPDIKPFYIDSVMVVRGNFKDTLEYNWNYSSGPDLSNKFFDGNSPGWIWNGLPHGSTSTGPIR